MPYEQTPEGKARFDWSQLDAARDVLSHGGQLDQRQEQMIKAILKAATGQAVKHDKILEVLNAINADNKTRDADFDRLVSALHRVDQTASRALEAAYNH